MPTNSTKPIPCIPAHPEMSSRPLTEFEKDFYSTLNNHYQSIANKETDPMWLKEHRKYIENTMKSQSISTIFVA